MRVVLLTDVPNVGKKDEIVEVKNGFGVNYLVPRGLAVLATEDAVLVAKTVSEKKQKVQEEQHSFVGSLIKKVDGKKVQVRAKASKGGTMFASLSEEDLAAALQKEWKTDKMNVEIKPLLAQPLKDIGKYPLDVEVVENGERTKVTIVLELVSEE